MISLDILHVINSILYIIPLKALKGSGLFMKGDDYFGGNSLASFLQS